MTKAFITGSHAYGEPRLDSDIDLVVLIGLQDLQTLKRLSGYVEKSRGTSDAGPSPGGESASLKFGNLNLIAVTDPIAYEVWRRGTSMLERHHVVPREVACALFKSLQGHYGLKENPPSVDDAEAHKS